MRACDRGAGACSLAAERSNSSCADACLRASCDWSEGNGACRGALDALGACPLFDAAAWHSASQQPRLTYVQGFGRCLDAAAECAASGACSVLDDGGRVLVEGAPGSGGAPLDVGQANGSCADKPRLPSRGFAYSEADMAAVAALSVHALLEKYPACGAQPLTVRGNVAGRDGGGVFASGCAEAGSSAQQRCLLGAAADEEHAAVVVVAENHAGGGGGGVLAACGNLARCSALAARTLALPFASSSGRRAAGSAGGAALLSLRGNTAAGYGDAMASAATELRVQLRQARYIPGVDALDIEVALEDERGQALRVGTAPPAFMLQLALLDPRNASLTLPLAPLLLPIAALPLHSAALGSAAVLPACPLGQSSVLLRVALAGGAFLAQPSPQQTVEVECAACPAAHALREAASGWSCSQCSAAQYVLDPADPSHECQACPLGLRCSGGSEVEVEVAGSVWEAVGGQLVLRHCPPGYQVLPAPSDAASWDPSLQRCAPCGAGEECTGGACMACVACQPGFHKPRPGAVACEPCGADWFASGSGAEACVACPPLSSTRNATAATSEQQCMCQDDHYPAVRDAAAVAPSVSEQGLQCVECPVGALCEATGECMLRGMPEAPGACSGRALVGTWAVDNSTGHWGLQDCPPGFDMLLLSPRLQACQPSKPDGAREWARPEQGGWSTRMALSVGLGVGLGVLVLLGGVVWYARRAWLVQRDVLASLRRQAAAAHHHHQQSSRELLPPADAIEMARKGDERAQHILQGMFPRHIAEAMIRGEEKHKEDRSESCAVFFSDICGFTDISSKLEAVQVTRMLDRLFEQFDQLAALHGVYKIDTIGDCYIGVTHLVHDQANQQHDQVARLAAFSLDALAAAAKTLIDVDDADKGCIRIRVGFDVGPVVGHVQGRRQKKYTIFGNTVNTASRMESTGVPGRIQCTGTAAALLKTQDPAFVLTRRGEVEVKGRGLMETFFVDGREGGSPMWDKAGPGGRSFRGAGAGEGNPARASSSKELQPAAAGNQENPDAGPESHSPLPASRQPMSGLPSAAAQQPEEDASRASGEEKGEREESALSLPAGPSSAPAHPPLVVVTVSSEHGQPLPDHAAATPHYQPAPAVASLHLPPSAPSNPAHAGSGGRARLRLVPLPPINRKPASGSPAGGGLLRTGSGNRVAPEPAVTGLPVSSLGSPRAVPTATVTGDVRQAAE